MKTTNRIRLATIIALSALPLTAGAGTDYDNDGKDDIAFHRPGGGWGSLPVLYGNGAGTWRSSNVGVPGWANQPDVVALPGDYNADGRADIAFHRPGGAWNSVPVLFATAAGGWSATNFVAPGWANEPGVIGLPGDYNADGRTDIAFHRPGSSWTALPVLFSNGNGSWNATNQAEPGFGKQPGAIALPGDYNADNKTDIAFHRPGSGWGSVPILFSNGNGTWTSTNVGVPSWANQPDVVALPGEYNGDGKADIAFHRPGGGWGSLPVLLSNGNGTWGTRNVGVPSWANASGVIGIAVDVNADNRTDVAFHRPGGGWNSVPVLRADGTGGWISSNFNAPTWANEAGAVAVPGDYSGDGKTDVAFHKPGGTWTAVSILFGNNNGSWGNSSQAAPGWANQPDVLAIQPYVPRYDPRDNVQDGGDVAYDWTPGDATSFRSAFEAFTAGLVWPSSGPIIITPPLSAYEQLQDTLGMTGAYDGTFFNGISTARVFAVLRNHQGEAHGKVTALGTLRFQDGFCGELELEDITLPIHLTTTGPTFPAPITQRSRFDGSGTTTREVSVLGLFSGQMVINFDVTLFNMWPSLQDSWMTGSIEIDVPWPCQDQQVAIQLERRNGALFTAFNYP